MMRRFTLALLHTLRKDLAFLNTAEPALKVAALVFAIGLISCVWYFGLGWWTKVVIFAPNKMAREAPRYEIAGVFLAAIVAMYFAWVVERARKDLRK